MMRTPVIGRSKSSIAMAPMVIHRVSWMLGSVSAIERWP
jgi:hypothetical protein